MIFFRDKKIQYKIFMNKKKREILKYNIWKRPVFKRNNFPLILIVFFFCLTFPRVVQKTVITFDYLLKK